MHIFCDSLVTTFNNGIGFVPVSQFMTIGTKPPISLENLYINLREVNCRDVIIKGILDEESQFGLSWLTVKLISEGYYISYLCNIQDVLPNLVVHRYIVNVDLESLKKVRRDIDGLCEKFLTEKNIVIFRENSVDNLMACKHLISKSKSRLMFDANMIDKNLLLENGIYSIYPYREDKDVA